MTTRSYVLIAAVLLVARLALLVASLRSPLRDPGFDIVLIVVLALLTGKRLATRGGHYATGVAAILITMALVPWSGPWIENLFIPEPGIDHGDWRGDISGWVAGCGWLAGLAVCAIASLPERRTASATP